MNTQDVETVTPAQAKERHQDGLAAAVRFVRNANLLPGGLQLEHLFHIFRFGKDKINAPRNLHPLNRDEFITAAEILHHVALNNFDFQIEAMALLLHLSTDTPTDDSVSIIDRSDVISKLKSISTTVKVSEIEKLSTYLSQEYELDRVSKKIINQDLGLQSKSDTESPSTISATKVLEAILSETIVITDGLVADTGQLSGLSRNDYLRLSRKLVALSSNSEVAARAMMRLALAPHQDEVTVELRTDSMSRLYRELSREDLRSSALKTSEQITFRGFKTRAELLEDEEE